MNPLLAMHFIVSQLCAHIGPRMIAPRGLVRFFALSLMPFFLLLTVLHNIERSSGRTELKTGGRSKLKMFEI